MYELSACVSSMFFIFHLLTLTLYPAVNLSFPISSEATEIRRGGEGEVERERERGSTPSFVFRNGGSARQSVRASFRLRVPS